MLEDKHMNERIKQIRTSLNLTLEKFGERLGVTKTAISNIEKGNRSVTEQMFKSVCREYNVNPQWLATGEGDMFINTNDILLDKINDILTSEDSTFKKFFLAIASLENEEKKVLNDLLNKIFNQMQ